MSSLSAEVVKTSTKNTHNISSYKFTSIIGKWANSGSCTGHKISFRAAISRRVVMEGEQGSSTVAAQQRGSNLNEDWTQYHVWQGPSSAVYLLHLRYIYSNSNPILKQWRKTTLIVTFKSSLVEYFSVSARKKMMKSHLLSKKIKNKIMNPLYWNVHKITSNIFCFRHNIYIWENMKMVLCLESHRPT